MSSYREQLQALPEASDGRPNNAQARLLSKTEAGRTALQRFAEEVARLVPTPDARLSALRAAEAQNWQESFEAAVDAQRELTTALWGEHGRLKVDGGPQAQRDAWAAQDAEFELLACRLMSQARSSA